MNLFKVSDGFGSHLPEPCSEQLGPLATIVPAGNKKISINLNPPWICVWNNYWSTTRIIYGIK